MNLTIGSGDCGSLLMGIKTKGYQELWQKFISSDKPHYNAFASPIDALRTGAILEQKYLEYLPDNYYSQVKATCKEFNVLTSSIDFSIMEKNKISSFEELKTAHFVDFVELIKPASELNEKEQIAFLNKYYKKNYNQAQFQLLCTDLESCHLVFLSVDSYDDDVNKARIIVENDIVKFQVNRDKKIIDFIKERAKLFQEVKNHFVNGKE